MKIDIAYSKEKHRLMTAIEANELWQNGELKDKHEFICPGKDCDVPITCAGMDKFKIEQKRIPHFIWGHRNPTHGKDCDFESVIYKYQQQSHSVKLANDKKSYNEVIFDFNNADTKNIIKKSSINNNSKNTKNSKGSKTNNNNQNNYSRIVKPHYSLLSSLLNLFFDAKENNDLDNRYVRMKFKRKSYDYKLSTLFKEIDKYELDHETKTKIFYGDAIVNKKNGNYYIKFEDKFKNYDAEVRCTIKEEDILKVKNASAKLQYFDRQLNEKLQIFIMGDLKKIEGKDNKKLVYINPYKKSFDLIAVATK